MNKYSYVIIEDEYGTYLFSFCSNGKTSIKPIKFK